VEVEVVVVMGVEDVAVEVRPVVDRDEDEDDDDPDAVNDPPPCLGHPPDPPNKPPHEDLGVLVDTLETLNQADLQRRLRMLMQDQEQLAQGREIANVTMTNSIVTSYKQGGRPSVQSTSSRYSS